MLNSFLDCMLAYIVDAISENYGLITAYKMQCMFVTQIVQNAHIFTKLYYLKIKPTSR